MCGSKGILTSLVGFFNKRVAPWFEGLLVSLVFLASPMAFAQSDSRRGSEELIKRFDFNGDGILLGDERVRARKAIQSSRVEGQVPSTNVSVTGKPAAKESPDDVPRYFGVDLFAPDVVRTWFLDFATEDWETEMSDFHGTDVLVPATLTIDGIPYQDVGVGFRGDASFENVPRGKKRSLKLLLDFVNPEQNVQGAQRLNLLNAYRDPSMLREILFNTVARNYFPAPKANLVRLVINGQSWGMYVQVQQVNREFFGEWFDQDDGSRWEMESEIGSKVFDYWGDRPDVYRDFYEPKSEATLRNWLDLVRACRELNRDGSSETVERLWRSFDVDQLLWLLAVENVLIDADGYGGKGGDYIIYHETKAGRFSLVPTDSSETFGGVSSASDGEAELGINLDPLELTRQGQAGLSSLLREPSFQARYLAHVETISEEWLSSGKLESLIKEQFQLLDRQQRNSEKQLYPQSDDNAVLDQDLVVEGGVVAGLLRFVERRREYYENYFGSLSQRPQIVSVERENYERAPQASDSVGIRVNLDGGGALRVLLHYAVSRSGPFESVIMTEMDDETFRGEISPVPAGSRVFYYAEVRSKSGEDVGVRFWPRGAEQGALSYRVVATDSSEVPIIISEIMADNESTVRDPQGEFDDWIELHNSGGREIDLSGMFLSDDRTDLRQWRFPKGSDILPGGYLLVWADGDSGAAGLHANFKLSTNGETLYLVDKDERGNAIIDELTFSAVSSDESFGRLSSGEQTTMLPSPGRGNR